MLLRWHAHRAARRRRQTLAYLRLAAKQALAAFQSHSAASIAGLPPAEQQVYVLRFLREYMSAPWHDALLRSLGHEPAAFSESAALPLAAS